MVFQNKTEDFQILQREFDRLKISYEEAVKTVRTRIYFI